MWTYGPQGWYNPQTGQFGGLGAYPQALPMQAAAPPAGIVQTPMVGPDDAQRTGKVQILQKEHFDTPIRGYAQLWAAATGGVIENFFNGQRGGNKLVCSIKENGKLSDERQFKAFATALQLEFEDPDLFEIFNFLYMEYKIQEVTKIFLWAQRVAAGGGSFGYNQVAGSFTKTWGEPNVRNVYPFGEELEYLLQRTFGVEAQFDVLAGAAAGQQPLAIFNAATTTRKLVRLFLIGEEIGDTRNR